MRQKWMPALGWMFLAACSGSPTSVDDEPTTPYTPTDDVTTPSPEPEPQVDRDGDGYNSAVDCDDGDRRIHPGAAEQCDGIDNDCDSATPDAGVAFVAEDGTWADWTAVFSAGTEEAPASIHLTETGTLHVCAGIWYAGLQLDADVSVVGAGSSYSILDGGSTGHGIWVDTPVDVSVEGLTLQNFVDNVPGPYDYYDFHTGTGTYGPALHCAQGANVVADDLLFLDNEPHVVGGAVSVRDNCTLTLSNSTFQGGSAYLGGQLAVSGAHADVSDTTFTGGSAAYAGGAVFVGEAFAYSYAPSSMTCTQCRFDGNATTDPGSLGGGAVFVYFHSTYTDLAGSFVDNATAGDGGAVYLNTFGAGKGPALGVADFDGTWFMGNTHGLAVANDVYAATAGTAHDFTASMRTIHCDDASGCK